MCAHHKWSCLCPAFAYGHWCPWSGNTSCCAVMGHRRREMISIISYFFVRNLVSLLKYFYSECSTTHLGCFGCTWWLQFSPVHSPECGEHVQAFVFRKSNLLWTSCPRVVPHFVYLCLSRSQYLNLDFKCRIGLVRGFLFPCLVTSGYGFCWSCCVACHASHKEAEFVFEVSAGSTQRKHPCSRRLSSLGHLLH